MPTYYPFNRYNRYNSFRNISRYNNIGYNPAFTHVTNDVENIPLDDNIVDEENKVINDSNEIINNLKEKSKTNIENFEINTTQKEEPKESTNTKDDTKSKSRSFRLGPIGYSNNTLNLFGFELALDDLIILALIFILLLDSDNNYPLIIVLGLMFFNINLSNIFDFKL